jgi:hypothetical protein
MTTWKKLLKDYCFAIVTGAFAGFAVLEARNVIGGNIVAIGYGIVLLLLGLVVCYIIDKIQE